MTPRLGTAFTFIIGRGHKESHGDLNKINRVKTNNKNIMKIPVISVIKKISILISSVSLMLNYFNS